MAETNCLLPPSPNWYCSSAAECNKSGIYIFAAKSHVFLLDVNCEPPVFRGQFTEHSERVNAVACSPDCKLCSSAGEDKTVRIWDMESRTIVASHNAHQNKVTCLCWSGVSSDLVFSADEKGTIIAWKHEKNVVYSFCPTQEYVFCISAPCQSKQLVAVGYKNGLIVVVQLQDQGLRVVHRLRGHDSDIHSLSWCPVSIDHLQLGHLQEKVMNSQENLLISGSRDQTLRLWDTLNGKVLSILNLPKRASQKWKDRHDWQSKDRVWLALCWPRSLPNKVISSSHSGELLLWDLSVPSGSDQFQYFSHGHSRIVFNISCNNDGTKAVSFSMDRQIIIWDLKTLHSLHCISTLGGYVYGLDISPLDPGTVAVGVGDNMIRIWNCNSTLGTYDAVTLWQGIKSKVQVVSWHPSKEGILAFGTDVGQVGIYNTVSKKPKVFASYHKNTVYSLSWGPPCPEDKDKNDDGLHLYSCSGDGSVMEHRPSQPLQDALNVNKLIESTNGAKHKLMSCSEVCWNCDRAFLAIGNSDGTIELFRAPSLRRVCTLSVHKKSITNLAWHPGYGEDNSEDEGRLPYRLASGSNETAIHIHDLSSVLITGDDETSVSTITSSYRKLVGHSGRVTSLCWSPHHRDMFVSASYDGTAQIWNVESNQTIANFRGHVGRLLSVQWSFLDADAVYSGGEDGSVRAWRISEQKYSQPPASGSKTSKTKKKSKSKPTESHETKKQTNSEMYPEQEALQKPDTNDGLSVASSSTEIGEKVESWRRPLTTSPVGSGDSFTPTQKIDGSVAVVPVDDDDAASVGSFSAQGSGPTIIVSKSLGRSINILISHAYIYVSWLGWRLHASEKLSKCIDKLPGITIVFFGIGIVLGIVLVALGIIMMSSFALVISHSLLLISRFTTYLCMGIVASRDEYLPLVALFSLFVFYIWNCFSSVGNTYKDLLNQTFDKCKEYQEKENRQVIIVDNEGIPRINRLSVLFQKVVDKILPFSKAYTIMCVKIAIIGSFLFLTYFSILVYGETSLNDVTKTLAVSLAGLIPKLIEIFRSGNSKDLIDKENAYRIKKIIQEFFNSVHGEQESIGETSERSTTNLSFGTSKARSDGRHHLVHADVNPRLTDINGDPSTETTPLLQLNQNASDVIEV